MAWLLEHRGWVMHAWSKHGMPTVFRKASMGIDMLPTTFDCLSTCLVGSRESESGAVSSM